jgi:hypothetical protein
LVVAQYFTVRQSISIVVVVVVVAAIEQRWARLDASRLTKGLTRIPGLFGVPKKEDTPKEDVPLALVRQGDGQGNGDGARGDGQGLSEACDGQGLNELEYSKSKEDEESLKGEALVTSDTSEAAVEDDSALERRG